METLKLLQKCSINYIQFMKMHLAWHQPAYTPSFPTKPKKTYDRVLQALIDLAPNCRPEKTLLDFLQAALQSFQKNSPKDNYSAVFSISPRIA